MGKRKTWIVGLVEENARLAQERRDLRRVVRRLTARLQELTEVQAQRNAQAEFDAMHQRARAWKAKP